MSFARFSAESNVYVYSDVGGYVCCCGCLLGSKWDFHSPAEVVAHLREHVAAGHKVPERLLSEDLYEPADFIAMCPIFMCREDIDHDGPHTPLAGHFEGEEDIRARQIALGVVKP